MSSSIDTDTLPFAEGAIAGAAAWIVGYVLTALVVFTRESSRLGEISENVGDNAGAFEFVGWVFFNSHFVDTVIEAGFLGFGGASTVSFIGGDGFPQMLYFIPIALLVASGLAIGRSQGVSEITDGAVSGVLVVPAYLVLSIAGALVFRVSAEALGATFSAEPDFLPAIILAGILIPAVFGAIGGILAAVTSDR